MFTYFTAHALVAMIQFVYPSIAGLTVIFVEVKR